MIYIVTFAAAWSLVEVPHQCSLKQPQTVCQRMDTVDYQSILIPRNSQQAGLDLGLYFLKPYSNVC